jgi:hypothetical protein
MTDVQQLFSEYTELMFPDASSIDESDKRGNEERYQQGRTRAMRIVDHLIQSGQYRSLT